MEDGAKGENWCKDNDEDIDSNKAEACDAEYDLCYFTYIGESTSGSQFGA